MSSFARVAAVTGANKGIGLAIVRNLALQYPKSAFNNGPLLIYLTARDKSRGEAALESIHNDAQLKQTKALAQDGGLATVRFRQLDISERRSIEEFARFLKREHPDGIDAVINNAGIAMNGFDINVVKTTLHCNYYGTLAATQLLVPLIRQGGRLVNVSSMSGQLNSKYSASIRERFLASKTVADVTALMEEFTNAVEAGKHEAQGWPSAAYAVSKSGVTGMTRAIALAEREKGSKVLINSCCPGFVNTDMTKGRGSKSVDEGAQTPVILGIGDIKDQTGLFWQHEKPIDW